jgi:hypothetical protein
MCSALKRDDMGRFARAGHLPVDGVDSIWDLIGVVEEALEVCCLDSR